MYKNVSIVRASLRAAGACTGRSVAWSIPLLAYAETVRRTIEMTFDRDGSGARLGTRDEKRVHAFDYGG